MNRTAALLLALLIVAGACSGDSAGPTASPAPGSEAPVTEVTATSAPTTIAASPTTTAPPATQAATTAPALFPVTISSGSGELTIPVLPERIVSLSPTATESLFAIGAGDQVVAADEFSDHPAEAPATDLSGITPNIEAIAAFDPDLVVIQFDPGDLVAGLAALGIPVLVQPSALSLDDAYAQIEDLGLATGRLDAATAVVQSMRETIEGLASSAPRPADPLTYYHELDDTLFSVTSSTFIGQVYSLFGLENIADPADEDGFGFPQLSPEFVIDQDPDLIFLADTRCCGQSAATLADRPGWGDLGAVRSGAVVELDDSVASRWGPRVVDFVTVIAEAVRSVESVG